MTAYRVYHAVPLHVPYVTPMPRWPADYREVALVRAGDVQGAFIATNSHDGHWSLNPGVTCLDTKARSSSIGDVVVTPEGKAYRCEGVGWSEL